MSVDLSQSYITASAERGKFARISDSWLSSMGYPVSSGDGRYAVLTYNVGGGGGSSPSSSTTSVIANTSVSIPLTGAAVSLVDFVTIDATCTFLRLSFTGPGDVNLTYDGTIPTSGTGGEIWFMGGILEVNATVAETIKFIKAGTTNSSVFVTQFS